LHIGPFFFSSLVPLLGVFPLFIYLFNLKTILAKANSCVSIVPGTILQSFLKKQMGK
jgi:hypothetical protein